MTDAEQMTKAWRAECRLREKLSARVRVLETERDLARERASWEADRGHSMRAALRTIGALACHDREVDAVHARAQGRAPLAAKLDAIAAQVAAALAVQPPPDPTAATQPPGVGFLKTESEGAAKEGSDHGE